MIAILIAMLTIGQPECRQAYNDCRDPAYTIYRACEQVCQAVLDKVDGPCEGEQHLCKGRSIWREFHACWSGPAPRVYIRIHYGWIADAARQLTYWGQVVDKVGWPYECLLKCDHDNDRDCDLLDWAQQQAWSSVRNCVARGGSIEECEEEHSK